MERLKSKMDDMEIFMVVQIFQIADTQKRFKKKKHGMQQCVCVHCEQ